ncbi:hypothetical protein Dimus_024546, partial [Dionaea muscipula]
MAVRRRCKDKEMWRKRRRRTPGLQESPSSQDPLLTESSFFRISAERSSVEIHPDLSVELPLLVVASLISAFASSWLSSGHRFIPWLGAQSRIHFTVRVTIGAIGSRFAEGELEATGE